MYRKFNRLCISITILATMLFGCQLMSSLVGPDSETPALGEEIRSEAGGYVLLTVPGWMQEESEGIALLSSPDGNIDVGPKFLLTGGMRQNGEITNEGLLREFTESNAGMEFSNQREREIGSIPGLAIDLEGEYDGTAVEGRIVVAKVSDQQFFQVIGISPAERWNEVNHLFDAVLSSVRFFDPGIKAEVMATPFTEAGDSPHVIPIHQWAVGATASSEYDNPDWAASQATGAPDTLECGDKPSAWASYEKDTEEWLEVTYQQPVIPIQVNIHQSHSSSQVVLVELVDSAGAYHVIYTGEPAITDCPFILSIAVQALDFKVQGVKITIDQTRLDMPWNEIDAVELVGNFEEQAAELAPQATTQPLPQPPAPQPTATSAGQAADLGEITSWRWSSYSSAQGLPSDQIKSVAVAADGTVWIGSAGAGISSFKDGRFTTFGEANGLKSNMVNAISVAPDGSVWAGTGLALSNYTGGSWINYTKSDGLVFDEVQSLAIADDGAVWIGTGLGLSRFDGIAWTTYHEEDGLVDNYISDIDIDQQGKLWFATYGGISAFDGKSWTNFTEADGLAYDISRAIKVASDGGVWVGTSSLGVSLLKDGIWTTYLESEDFDLKYVKAIVQASDGAMWFATEGEGVYRFDGLSWLNFRKEDGLPDDWVDAMAIAPDGAMWFGCRKGGLARFGP